MEHIYSRQGKRGDLIKASIELFAARGYDGVSVRDIAKAAGVTEAALYKHFRGKEEMSLYIFKEIIKDYTDRIKRINAQELTAIEKLCQIVALTYDLYEIRPAEISFALLSQYKFWDSLENEIKPHFLIRAMLEEGMENGEIPREEVYMLITVYTGLLLEPLIQYSFFHDALPSLQEMKVRVMQKVRKLLG